MPTSRILSLGRPSRQRCAGEAQPGRHRLATPVAAAAAAATAAAATHTPSVQRRWSGPALSGTAQSPACNSVAGHQAEEASSRLARFFQASPRPPKLLVG